MDDIKHNAELLSSATQPSWTQEFLRSAVYSGLQAPAVGVAQLIDKSIGTELVPKVQFMEASKESEFMSSRWHAQTLGSMVGMAAPFLLLHKGVGKCGNLMLGKLENTAATDVLTRRVVGESIVTGAAFEGLFRPVAPAQEDNFLKTRINNALVGGATFGLLTRTTVGIQSLMQAEVGIGAAMIRSEIGSTMMAGVPAGILNAELSSRLNHGHGASRQQMAEGVYSFAVLGGTMAAGKHVIGGTMADTALSKQMKETSLAAREAGAPTIGERLGARIGQISDVLANGLRGSGPQLAFAFEGAGVTQPVRASLPDSHIVQMSMSRAKGPLRGGIGDNVIEYAPAPEPLVRPEPVRPAAPEKASTGTAKPVEAVPEAKPVVSPEAPRPEIVRPVEVAKPVRPPKEVAREAVNRVVDVIREHQQRQVLEDNFTAAESRLAQLRDSKPAPEKVAEHQRQVREAEGQVRRAELELHLDQKWLHPDRPLLALKEAVDASIKAIEAESPVVRTGPLSPRQQLAAQTRFALEDLMSRIPRATDGVQGGRPLPEFPGLRAQDPLVRLRQVSEHLNKRLIESGMVKPPAEVPSTITGTAPPGLRPTAEKVAPPAESRPAVEPVRPDVKPTEARAPEVARPGTSPVAPAGDAPPYSRTVPGAVAANDIVITNTYMEFTHPSSGQRMRLQFEHTTGLNRVPPAELQTMLERNIQIREGGEAGPWQTGRLVGINGDNLTVRVGTRDVVVNRADAQVQGIRNSHVDAIYERFVNPSDPRPFIPTEDGAYVGQSPPPEAALNVGTHTQTIAGRGEVALPREVLASATLGSVLSGRTFMDLMPQTRTNYELAAAQIPLAEIQGALGNGRHMRELFARVVRGDQPPAVPTDTSTGPGPGPGPNLPGTITPTVAPEGVVQRSPLSEVTTRALLQMAALDLAAGATPATLRYGSLAEAATMIRNALGTGGNPLSSATSRAAIGRALEIGHLAPTDNIATLSTRIQGLGNELRYENLRRPGN